MIQSYPESRFHPPLCVILLCSSEGLYAWDFGTFEPLIGYWMTFSHGNVTGIDEKVIWAKELPTLEEINKKKEATDE